MKILASFVLALASSMALEIIVHSPTLETLKGSLLQTSALFSLSTAAYRIGEPHSIFLGQAN